MSVIAWDGKWLVADRQACDSGMRIATEKIAFRKDAIIAGSGYESSLLMFMRWYDEGADPAKWPECQKGDHWTKAVVMRKGEPLLYYERESVAIEITRDTEYMAWGSGADYAMGAMAMGADAMQAVRIACKHCFECGHGLTAMWFDEHGEVCSHTENMNYATEVDPHGLQAD